MGSILAVLFDMKDNVENVLSQTSEGFDILEELAEAIAEKDCQAVEDCLDALRDCFAEIESETEAVYEHIGISED
jgi:hypothetical protein